MNLLHVKAIFKAEYYTTTARFRAIRKWIPFIFMLGVILFSLLIRVVFDFLGGDVEIHDLPIGDFYSIIAIFSYFILFAPLLSPLGRVVYDGDAKSRREVALNSPVASKDLLYGNLLSNLIFFLPFFAFIGTLALTPFIINGQRNPLVTSIILFLILGLLILIGLIAGTILTPIIYNFVARQQGARSRALVTVGVSIMLVLSLPLLRYLLENIDHYQKNDLILYLPFTLAASLIIYLLYGTVIGPEPLSSLSLLVVYLIAIYFLGYVSADRLYGMADEEAIITISNPSSTLNRVVGVVTFFLPQSLKYTTRSLLKASMRDIEHMARLTIGIAVSIFMIFALSSQGLFRNTVGYSVQIELAVVIFALVLSSASVIFIEAASFTIQHRDMLALVKSAPLGSRKFIIAKILQMYYILLPVFMAIIVVLTQIHLLSAANFFPTVYFLFLSISSMVTVSIAIYMVNASDNQEDISNFANLMVFYLFAFVLATIPVAITLIRNSLQVSDYLIGTFGILIISLISIKVAVESLEQMDLETLSSPYSASIRRAFFTGILFFVGITVIPLFPVFIAIQIRSESVFLVLLVNNFAILLLPLTYYILMKRDVKILSRIQSRSLKYTSITFIVMLLLGSGIQLVYNTFFQPLQQSSIYLNLSISEFIIILAIGAFAEEVFFRGLLYDFARVKMNPRNATITSSFLFGLAHLITFPSFLNAMIQGVLLSNLRQKTSIWHVFIVHLLYNIMLILIFSI